MRNSSKQDKWANDIRVRINLLLNGFEAKCFSPTDDDLDLINEKRVDLFEFRNCKNVINYTENRDDTHHPYTPFR